MPVENEIATILDFELTPDKLEAEGWRKVPIRQGYLENGGRIRDYGGKRIFTMKYSITGKTAPIEIETELDEQDFSDLWSECKAFVSKDRYYFPENTNEIVWSVDFIKDKQDNIIMVRAEVEMPENMTQPPFPPDIIEPHIFYQIPQPGHAFSNYSMAKGGPEYIGQLLSTIGLKKTNDFNTLDI